MCPPKIVQCALIFTTYSTYHLLMCCRNKDNFLPIVTRARRNKNCARGAQSPEKRSTIFITFSFSRFHYNHLRIHSTLSSEPIEICRTGFKLRRVVLLCLHHFVPKARHVALLTLSRRLSEVTDEWEPIVPQLSYETTESGSCSTWPSGLCACMQHICPYFVTPLFISPLFVNNTSTVWLHCVPKWALLCPTKVCSWHTGSPACGKVPWSLILSHRRSLISWLHWDAQSLDCNTDLLSSMIHTHTWFLFLMTCIFSACLLSVFNILFSSVASQSACLKCTTRHTRGQKKMTQKHVFDRHANDTLPSFSKDCWSRKCYSVVPICTCNNLRLAAEGRIHNRRSNLLAFVPHLNVSVASLQLRGHKSNK